MNSKKCVWILLCALLFVYGCRKHDFRTVVIEVPQLRGQECAQRLHRTLLTMNGVVGDSLFLEPGSVRVTYDSMRLALKNLEYAIAAEGFQANEIPPDPAARERLPERCR